MLNLTAALVLLATLASGASAYKIAIFVPDVANSQIIWNYRLAETLQKAGHQVTLIRLLMMPTLKKELPLMPGIKEWKFYGYNDTSKAPNVTEVMSSVYGDLPLYSSGFRKLMSFLTGVMVDACESFVQNKKLLRRLKEAKFDLAFADMGGMCSIGLIHYARIPTWIWMNNGPLLDFVADIVGVHSPSSYVPPIMGAFMDVMSFPERMQSFITWSIFPVLFKRFIAGRQTEMFRKHVDPRFPSLADIGAKCPLIMVNNDEMYAYPRPILHKVVYVGGLGMNQEAAKPLTGEFKTIADRATNIMVFSFGSVANATLMPEAWKTAFLESFRLFPDTEFIIRYDIDDLKYRLPPNVHTFKWLPQNDLLHFPKTRALITHGGFNSVQEAINAGTPVIAIPLFGDQLNNARLVEKRQIGIVLKKSEIGKMSISRAVKQILEDNSYTKSVQRLRDMIRKKPFKPDETVVRWTEFAAEFKDLSNLTPQGAKLGFIKYYCIDVVVVLVSVISFFLVCLYELLCCLFSLCRRKKPEAQSQPQKEEKEKKLEEREKKQEEKEKKQDKKKKKKNE